ncbi:hypothetical protein I3843_04G123900 [Carya illinoinensis]|nr:hypothetical protein I3843_04G123900 [Carya illinoinensis]
MRGFRDALDYCQLRSLPAVRPLFIWSNLKEGSTLVHERLYRFGSNVDWLELYPYCRVSNLITPVSHHNCLILSTDALVQTVSKKSCLFKFESMWMGERSCEESIASAWSLNFNASFIDKIK